MLRFALALTYSLLFCACASAQFGQGAPSPQIGMQCLATGCDNPGAVPVGVANLSGCSTGAPAVSGNMMRGLVVAGTTASTTCTITWPQTRQNTPNCALTAHTALAGAPFITVENTTTLTWTFTSVASSTWDYVCLGY